MPTKNKKQTNKNKGNFQDILQQIRSSEGYEIEEVRDSISESIYRAMREHAITKAELARRLDTSAAYITKLLQGNGNFTIETLVKIARALGYKFKPVFQATQPSWKPVAREIIESPSFQPLEKIANENRFKPVNSFGAVLDKSQMSIEINNERAGSSIGG